MTPFDAARIRHNFERVCGPPESPLPERWTAVEEPNDHVPEARRLLREIRALSERRYRDKWSLLAPFFGEAERVLTALEVISASVEAGTMPARGAEEPSELRAELLAVLWEIEDLLEVVGEIGFG